MATYDNVLFPGGDLDKPITISAANRYIRRIRLDMFGVNEAERQSSSWDVWNLELPSVSSDQKPS
ncbi:hypothetical protein AYY22_01945 [Photobacterium kishitanii]|nr:hypothetical protein AYY22_01945 [Photobacterium kishitanii]